MDSILRGLFLGNPFFGRRRQAEYTDPGEKDGSERRNSVSLLFRAHQWSEIGYRLQCRAEPDPREEEEQEEVEERKTGRSLRLIVLKQPSWVGTEIDGWTIGSILCTEFVYSDDKT